jgi:hypothetical protein
MPYSLNVKNLVLHRNQGQREAKGSEGGEEGGEERERERVFKIQKRFKDLNAPFQTRGAPVPSIPYSIG